MFTEAEAASARLMPVATAADTGKKLLCPMPGLIVSIAVTEGQEVKAGETLAVVEAMKMQNVLRAERDGTVKKNSRLRRRDAGGGRADSGVCVRAQSRHCCSNSVIASEAKQSRATKRTGLLRRGAFHRARRAATSWLLAMT